MKTFDKKLIGFLSLVYFFSFLGYFASSFEESDKLPDRFINGYETSTYFVNTVRLNSISTGVGYSNDEKEEDF